MHTFSKVMLPQSLLKGDVSSLSLLGCKDSQWREKNNLKKLDLSDYWSVLT